MSEIVLLFQYITSWYFGLKEDYSMVFLTIISFQLSCFAKHEHWHSKKDKKCSCEMKEMAMKDQ